MSALKIYEGLFLAENCFIENLRLENLENTPTNLASAGRVWFQDNEVKISVMNEAQQLSVKSLVFKEDLPTLVQDIVSQMNIIEGPGWRDEFGNFNSAKTNKTTEPIWADIGNGIFAYHFSDDKDMEVFINYHINHYLKPGSKVYPHVHWLPIGYSTGTVRWKIEYALAKGYQQGQSLTVPLQTIILEQSASGILDGEHYIIEATEAQAFTVDEPDTMVVCKVSREATHPNDTFVGSIAGLTMDLHVYSDGNETTVGKNYPFDIPVLP